MKTNPKLEDCLREHGLFVRGVTRLSDAEIDRYGCDPSNPEIALIGNIGSSYWAYFSQSAEFTDGAAHPLDRWSRRVAETIAKQLSLQALYPFEGPPYYPFQQWARRAEGLESSPVGVMIHPQFGLWHSYRFALLGTGFGVETAGVSAPSAVDPANVSPCLDCVSQPCLHSCPVAAFDATGYAVERCFDYLHQTPQADCHRQGCLARIACPIAPNLSYIAAQGRFHLRAFLQAQQARSAT
jgi:hypothetical protein